MWPAVPQGVFRECSMRRLKRFVKSRLWRSKNKHNETRMEGDNFPLGKVAVGKATYGPIHAVSFGDVNEGLVIGDFCSIGDNVTFLLGGGHPMDCLSTFPFRAKYLGHSNSTTKGKIVVEDDVWIGYGATIMPGVHMGQGCVVGAGALVTKDVPPYAVVGGVPAKIIEYRFSSDLRKRLQQLNLSRLSTDFINNHLDLLETKVSMDNVEILEQYLNESYKEEIADA